MHNAHRSEPKKKAVVSTNHIIEVYAETQKWALKDTNTDFWELEALDADKAGGYRRSGYVCGLWEAMFLLMGCPMLVAVQSGIFTPFGMERLDWWIWGLLPVMFFIFPFVHFCIGLAGVRLIRGPFSYEVWSTFLNMRALVCLSVVAAGVFCYGWLVPEHMTDITFPARITGGTLALLRAGMQRFVYLCVKSIYYLIPVSLAFSLIPVIAHRIGGIRNMKKAELANQLKNN